MNKKKIGLLLVLIVSVGISVSACSGRSCHFRWADPEYREARTGPPPHAPAHGYRHKHSNGVELVYQSSTGVYLVAGYSNYYFYNNKYFRLKNGSWEASVHLDRSWKQVSEKKLPPGLQKKKNKGKKRK